MKIKKAVSSQKNEPESSLWYLFARIRRIPTARHLRNECVSNDMIPSTFQLRLERGFVEADLVCCKTYVLSSHQNK